jgi:hypothetical protein
LPEALQGFGVLPSSTPAALQRSGVMVVQNSPSKYPALEESVVSPQSASAIGVRHIAVSLERIERSKGSTIEQARRRIASKVRIGVGSVENIIRDRVKRVDEKIRDRLFALFVREIEAEIARLTHDLEMVRQSSGGLSSQHVGEIEAHLSAVKSLLKLNGSGRPRA